MTQTGWNANKKKKKHTEIHLNLLNGTDHFYFQNENRSRVARTGLSVNNVYNHDRKFASNRLDRSLSKRLDPPLGMPRRNRIPHVVFLL